MGGYPLVFGFCLNSVYIPFKMGMLNGLKEAGQSTYFFYLSVEFRIAYQRNISVEGVIKNMIGFIT